MGIETAIALGAGAITAGAVAKNNKGKKGDSMDSAGMGFSEAPSLGDAYGGLFNVQKRYMPQKYALEKNWGPQFNALNLQNMQNMAPEYQKLLLGLQKEFAPQNMDWMMEMKDRYNGKLMNQDAQAQNMGRDLELAAIEKYGPLLKQAMENVNPQETAIRNALGDRTQTELGYGSRLDPQGARNMQQGVRAAQSARGMTQGAAPVSEESRMTYQQGENLKNQREQKAFSYLSLPQFNPMGALGLGKEAYSQANPVSMGVAGSGTEGMGMVKDRGPGLVDMSALGGAYNTASNNWQSQQANAMRAQAGDGQGGSSWMNMLPLMGAGLGMAGAGLGGMNWGGLFGGGAGTMPLTGSMQAGATPGSFLGDGGAGNLTAGWSGF